MKPSSSLIGGLALLLLTTCVMDVSAQDQQRAAALDSISKAFAEGDVRTIIEHSSERIELSIFGNSTLYSRSQATYVLQEFFRDHRPTGCDFDDISLAGDSQFATGRLAVRGLDEPLQVFVRLRPREEEWTVREIRIERSR